jgi:O-antigen ligase
LKYSFRNYLYVITTIASCFTNYLFFSLYALTGNKYSGSGESISYVLYLILNFILIFILNITSSNKNKLLKYEFNFYLFLTLLFIIQLIWFLKDPDDLYFLTFISYFILLGLPGFFAILVLIKNNLINLFIKLSDIFCLIVLISIIFTTLKSFFIDDSIDTAIGGTDYQFFSYLCALVYGILIFNTFKLESFFRFNFFNSKIYKKFTYLFLIVCIAGSILGGGRGAFLLVIIYSFSALKFLSTNRKNLILYVFSFLTLVAIFIIYLSFNEDSIFNRFGRLFSYINSDTYIDLENGSSGRDTIYKLSLDSFLKSPIFGYGPFGVWSKVGMPHNIFLELILQYGILAFFMIFYFLYYFIYNSKLKKLPFYNWFIHLSFFPIIMLMFSGSYMHLSIFWFVFSYFLIQKKYSCTL